MAWTNLTKPAAGEPGKKTLIDAIIDNLVHLFGLAGSSTIQAGANGSFENDTDADGVPDSWVFASLPNGTGAIDSTDSSHGGKSFKFVRSAGVGNGGGTLTSDDYFECGPNRRLVAQWQMKCSAAGVHVKVEMLFFTRALAAVSTVIMYDSTANPTAWTYKTGDADPPATAYYAKLKITGGATDTDVAASIWFDDLLISPAGRATGNHIAFTANGTWNCRVARARIRAWGAGGGGGGGSGGSNGGGGGGGGAYGEEWVDCVPGTAYAVTVPTGGAGGTAVPGTNGGAPAAASVGSLISVDSGTGGTRGEDGGGGGAGGSGPAVTLSFGGESGGNQNSGAGGNGGEGGNGGRGGIIAAQAGRIPGGGGRGGANGANGAAGGNARVVIDW